MFFLRSKKHSGMKASRPNSQEFHDRHTAGSRPTSLQSTSRRNDTSVAAHANTITSESNNCTSDITLSKQELNQAQSTMTMANNSMQNHHQQQAGYGIERKAMIEKKLSGTPPLGPKKKLSQSPLSSLRFALDCYNTNGNSTRITKLKPYAPSHARSCAPTGETDNKKERILQEYVDLKRECSQRSIIDEIYEFGNDHQHVNMFNGNCQFNGTAGKTISSYSGYNSNSNRSISSRRTSITSTSIIEEIDALEQLYDLIDA